MIFPVLSRISSNCSSPEAEPRRGSLRGMRALLPIWLLFLLLAGACSEKDAKVATEKGLKTAGMPTMATRNIATLISDSGITQYKIVAPLWRVYDEVDTPYWDFPEGVYLQKFDRLFRIVASVAADSAKFFKEKRLWRLDGNVEVKRIPKTLFATNQLFWDQGKRAIYSDSFIHIETPTQTLEGYGFISNEELTQYNISRPSGIFPVNKDDVTNPNRP